MIKQWVLSPLAEAEKISERQSSICDLLKIKKPLDSFRKKLSQLPDLERLVNKVFVYSVKNVAKQVYFENVQQTKLREFKALLKWFKMVE